MLSIPNQKSNLLGWWCFEGIFTLLILRYRAVLSFFTERYHWPSKISLRLRISFLLDSVWLFHLWILGFIGRDVFIAIFLYDARLNFWEMDHLWFSLVRWCTSNQRMEVFWVLLAYSKKSQSVQLKTIFELSYLYYFSLAFYIEFLKKRKN